MARIGIDARLTYYRHGGIAQYIHHLINELPTVDQINNYAILHQWKDRRNLAKAPNQRKVSCWTPAHHRLERLALAVEVAPLRLDLLHSPDFIPPYNGRYRSVITIHDLTFLHYPEFLTPESRRYYNEQIEAAVRRADHIMTDSEATRIDVLNLLDCDLERVSTVWLGIGKQFQPASTEVVADFLSRNDLERGYILFVGTFEPRKNLKGLIRAYKMVRNGLPDAPALVVAGQRGWLYEEIFDLIRQLGLEKSVRWLENTPPEDMAALYSGAGVLCLPSFYEGFGFPPLEAMACGTPAVVADRASLPEVVGDAGLLVNPEEDESIADGLRRVLTDSDLAMNLRTQGLEHVKRFTWNETARKVYSTYQKVLED